MERQTAFSRIEQDAPSFGSHHHSSFETAAASSHSSSNHDRHAHRLPLHLQALLSIPISPTDIRHTLNRSDQTGESPHDILISQGKCSAKTFTIALANALELPIVEAKQIVVDSQAVGMLTDKGQKPQPLTRLDHQACGYDYAFTPLLIGGAGIAKIEQVLALCDLGVKIVVITPQCLNEALLRANRWHIPDHAELGLAILAPHYSARTSLSTAQKTAILCVAVCLMVFAFVHLKAVLSFLFLCLSCLFLLQAIVRLMALYDIEEVGTPTPSLSDNALPIYSVLIPIYREAVLIPDLARMLSNIDYPRAKLDVKLIVEANDFETLFANEMQDFAFPVETIIAPPGVPQTKPRALNLALPLTHGEYVVIYDAEDEPEPQQLRIAADMFAHTPPEIAVLQARLGFYNRQENWLSRQFSIEYAALFNLTLPMLERIKLPIPLGGNSNHFRRKALSAVGAWDPFNVTEDADLGVRLARHGYQCRIMPSFTVEEAACQAGNWMRQRTRWLKGWMQTYIVHMRTPVSLFKQLGIRGFLGFQAVIGGMFLSPLVHPIFAAGLFVAIFQASQNSLIFTALDGITAAFGLVVFTIGYGSGFAINLAATHRQGWRGMRLAILTMPIYWLCIGFSGYRAAIHYWLKPHLWEKTEHGLSQFRGRHQTSDMPPGV